MAIQTINVGYAANDGTGDDLREAMIKINQNFQELDSYATQTGANLGTSGVRVFNDEVSTSTVLSFRRLVDGNNITLQEFDNTIVVNANIPDSRFIISTDSGSMTAGNGINYNLVGGDGASIAADENTKTITITSTLEQDLTPVLGASLDGNGLNITNVGTTSTTTLLANTATITTSNVTTANITNLVPTNINGVDYQSRLGNYIEGWDFGGFDAPINSILDWVIQSVGVDFGSFTAPTSGTVDLGNIL